MYTDKAIDVVIPSFRVDENILTHIFNVDQPSDFRINFFVIADNPKMEVAEGIRLMAKEGRINLIVNEVNLGFSGNRNKGIRLGNSKWLLLLDDDISPDRRLLIAYRNAILKHPDALGFAGVTNFPEPFNSETLALELSGSTGHCKAAMGDAELMWVPTTNIMLNREKMDPALFDEQLKKGGEDVEFFVRNALKNEQKYIGVRDAIVEHPWWDGGTAKRQFRYGQGAAQIAGLPAINEYTFHDFTNTSETLLLLVVSAPIILIYGSPGLYLSLLTVICLSELITNLIRSIYLSGRLSIGLAYQLLLIKNCHEAGYMVDSLMKGRLSGITERIDLGFSKKHPGWFRLNKWKITKMLLIGLGLLLIL